MGHSAKSGLFLIELIIAIAFFSVASAICIQLFAHAHLVSVNSHNLNMAVTYSRSAAECFKAADGTIDDLAQLLPGGVKTEGDCVSLYYDNNWSLQPNSENAKFQLDLWLNTDNAVSEASIEVYNNETQETIYQTQAARYTSA